MPIRNFRVTVDGQSFNVVVEEIESKKKAAPTPVSEPRVARPEPAVPKPAVPVKGKPQVSSAASGGTTIPTPMPGAIIDIKVSEGDMVSEGDVLIILEAMKMENDIVSPVRGKVSRIIVKKGDTVNSGDPLVIIE